MAISEKVDKLIQLLKRELEDEYPNFKVRVKVSLEQHFLPSRGQAHEIVSEVANSWGNNIDIEHSQYDGTQWATAKHGLKEVTAFYSDWRI